MSYENMYKLAGDADFHGRVMACCIEQAATFKDSMDYSIKMLAETIISVPAAAEGIFTNACASPNFANASSSAEIADGDILAVVQYIWPIYAGVKYPPPPPPPLEPQPTQ